MPQASEELRADWPGGDCEALDHLKPNFTVSRGGVIHRRSESYELSLRDWSALSYLVHEWDYGYSMRTEPADGDARGIPRDGQ